MSETITYTDMHRQVTASLGDWAEEFDTERITTALIDTYGLVGVDTITPAQFWAACESHDGTLSPAERAVAAALHRLVRAATDNGLDVLTTEVGDTRWGAGHR